MSEQEKQEIIKELEKTIIEKMKGSVIKEDTQTTLKEPRTKWFKNTITNNNESLMYEAFGTYVYWVVWEMVRKLTCYICGVRYVRELEKNKKSDIVAEKLCQFIYDLRQEILKDNQKEQEEE